MNFTTSSVEERRNGFHISSHGRKEDDKLVKDISTNISEDDYRFVQPFIREQCQKDRLYLVSSDHGGAMHHLPAILSGIRGTECYLNGLKGR